MGSGNPRAGPAPASCSRKREPFYYSNSVGRSPLAGLAVRPISKAILTLHDKRISDYGRRGSTPRATPFFSGSECPTLDRGRVRGVKIGGTGLWYTPGMAASNPEIRLSEEDAAAAFDRFKENARRLATTVPKDRTAKRKPSRAKAASKARRSAD